MIARLSYKEKDSTLHKVQIMSTFLPNGQYNRRKILRLASLAAGASLLPTACRSLDYSGGKIPATAQNTASPAPQPPAPSQTSKVVLVYSEDRAEGTQKALDILQPKGIKDRTAFLKPNYNTGDPAPAATDTKLLETLIRELQAAGAKSITIGDRSGMADTREAMQNKGVFDLAERYGVEAIVFDEMTAEQWQYVAAEGTHWKQGFAFAVPILEAGAVINTCCLKTHRFGGHFTENFGSKAPSFRTAFKEFLCSLESGEWGVGSGKWGVGSGLGFCLASA